jgi:acetylornithine deacetylase/succinyl-diaminopimelate desuccinylase-like protein
MKTYNTYKQLLKKFISFKSISTDEKFSKDLENTAVWISEYLKSSGMETKLLRASVGNPVVFASYNARKDLETVLIYGHYDVQPAKKSDGWSKEPFSLTEKKGRLVARGVVDNKGQILAYMVTVAELIKSGKLAYNVKFLIEGNEESGSGELEEILRKYKNELECDFVLISDGELTNGMPTIEVSLRGGFNATLKYKTGKTNLHSGIFGGAIPNAAHELMKFFAKLYDDEGAVSFEKFYENTNLPSEEELKRNKRLSKNADIKSIAGVNTLCLPKGRDFFTQTGLFPTIQITGIQTGYTSQGYANIVPAESEARLNFRIVASQSPAKIAKNFEKFVKENTPKYVEYSLTFGGLHHPIKVNMDSIYLERVENKLEEIYKSPVARKNVGGAIPFVADVKKILGADTMLVPFCNEDCNMHGINENFEIKLIKKSLMFAGKFLSEK